MRCGGPRFFAPNDCAAAQAVRRTAESSSEIFNQHHFATSGHGNLFMNRHTAACSTTYLLLSQRKYSILPLGNQNGGAMKQKTDVLQGTLALMVLKTLDVLGPQHGYGIARRIEQISGDLLAVNQGTLYPVLLKLEQEGAIASEWGASENNRRARFYRLTREGRKQLQVETQDWEQTAAIIARFFEVKTEDLS
jgi:transcriptional regulator